MAGRFETDRDWEWRSQDAGRRAEGDRWRGQEDRSFGPPDRVFGERESGMGYNIPRDDAQGDRAMPRSDYETGYRTTPHTQRLGDVRRARFYTDDERGPGYARPEGPGHLHDAEGRRFGSGEADARYARATGRPYEDGERFEEMARAAGGRLRRTGERIAGWFGDAAAEYQHGTENDNRFAAQPSARGLGPKGYSRPDDRISDDIHHRLTDDHWLDASDVEITVTGGEVTLSGTVKSREAKHRTEHLAEVVSGVKQVQNNLRIATAATSVQDKA